MAGARGWLAWAVCMALLGCGGEASNVASGEARTSGSPQDGGVIGAEQDAGATESSGQATSQGTPGVPDGGPDASSSGSSSSSAAPASSFSPSSAAPVASTSASGSVGTSAGAGASDGAASSDASGAPSSGAPSSGASSAPGASLSSPASASAGASSAGAPGSSGGGSPVRNNGGFAAPVHFAGLAGMLDMASSDFNRDGQPDVVVTGTQGTALVLGAGGGLAYPQAPLTQTGRLVRTADFNADGWEDALVAEWSDGVVRVNALWGSAAGLSTAAPTVCSAEEPVGAVTVGDVTGDGVADVVMQFNDRRRVGSSFNNFHMLRVCAGGAGPTWVRSDLTVQRSTELWGTHTLANLDADAALEIVLNDPDEEEIQRVDWDTQAVSTLRGAVSEVRAVGVVDVFGRGVKDVVVSRRYEDWVFPGQPSGTGYGPTQETSLCGVRRHGDYNGDGRPDFVAPAGDSGICLSMSAGAFTMTVDYGAPRLIPVGRPVDTVVTVDLDGDGRLDVLTLSQAHQDITFVRGL